MILPSSARVAPVPDPYRKKHSRRGSGALPRRLRCCWKCVRWVGPRLAIRIVVIAATILAVFSAANLIYQVARKPTEMFFPASGTLNKMPLETWRQYAPLFREYSTAAITPELLAALAQVESAGKHLLAVASDLGSLRDLPASIEQCRHVPDDQPNLRRDQALLHPPSYRRERRLFMERTLSTGCAQPRVEPTPVYLDRNVTQIVAHRRPASTPQQKEELAAIIHLCGAGSARVFARRGFSLTAGERCGDHDVAAYLAQISVMKQEFQRFAANERAI